MRDDGGARAGFSLACRIEPWGTVGGDLGYNGFAVRAHADGNAFFTGRVLGNASKGEVVLASAYGNLFLVEFIFEPAWRRHPE